HPGADRARAGGGRHMTRRRIAVALILVVALAGASAYYVIASRPAGLVLTGIVTTDDGVVSPQGGGQIGRPLVEKCGAGVGATRSCASSCWPSSLPTSSRPTGRTTPRAPRAPRRR